jgi:acyl dehydratase
MRRFGSVDDLAAVVGQRLGTSSWMEVTGERVEAFGAAVGYPHPARTCTMPASREPATAPLVHELVLALIPAVVFEVVTIDVPMLVVNKGMSRARFVAPVPVGALVRGHVAVADFRTRTRGFREVTYQIEFQLAMGSVPALTAEPVLLYSEQPT